MSEKTDPIVPSVLYVTEQHHPWQLAPIERLVVRYHTATTVFLDFGTIDLSVRPIAGRNGASKQHYHVWCLPDQEAYERVQAERAAFQAAIDALVAQLRRLGRYADRLVEAGGIARASNPLVPTVISAPDPDVTPKNWFTTHPVPQLTRRVVISHTAKMLRCQASYNPETEVPHHQREHFVCPTDADWEGVLALHQAALAAEQRWNALLGELGTYRDALADGRYANCTGTVAAQAEEVAPLAALPLIESYRVDETDLDADLLGQLQAAGYRWSGAKRTPDGHWHHVVTLGTQGVRARRERLLLLVRPVVSLESALDITPERVEGEAPAGAETLVDTAISMTLSSALVDLARRYVAAREQAGVALLEMAAALASARALTKHGEWYAFLTTIDTSADHADRLLAIHEQAMCNTAFADAVRRNFLTPTTAALLARPSTPPAVRETVLAAPEPPSKRQIEQHIQATRREESRSRAGAGSDLAPVEARLESPVPSQIAETHESTSKSRAGAGFATPMGAPAEQQTHEADADTSRSRSAAGSAPSPVEVTPVPLTPEARDADGPWFWASKSVAHPTAHHWRARPSERGRYVSACGIEMDSLPTTGAQAGHCSVCERNAARRETIPIPLPAGAEPAPDAAPMTDAGRVAALRHYLEQQRRAGLIHHAETADTAWRMASDIHDGDTFRSMAREIDEATSRDRRPLAPVIVEAALVESPSSSESETPTPMASIPIGVYASAVMMLSTIRTALMTNQRGLALDQALELVWVLTGADKRVSHRLLQLADALVGDKLAVGSAELGDGEAAGLDDATHKALAVYRQARVADGER